MRANQFIPGYVSQTVKVESKFTDYELAVMEGGLSLDIPKSALHQAVTEAFDQPYKILRWEKGDFGDVDAIARLDDNTFLSIMFNKGFSQGTKEEVWSVEFYRNNSQEVTGEGDAQRVFATVLSAIQTFIKEYTPNKITFSASKEVEQGQNTESRAKLYDSLVQRYARSWGFRAFRADTGNKVIYELSRIKPIVAKSVAEGSWKKPKFNTDTVVYDGAKANGISIFSAGYHPDIETAWIEAIKSVEPGAGATMVKSFEQWAKSQGAKTIRAEALQPSLNFWKKMGFDVVGNPSSKNRVPIEKHIGQQGVAENFADGNVKGKSSPGRVKRSGASCDGSVTDLRSKAKNASGERAKMYHWCANMKSGRAKNESEMLEDLNTIWQDVLEAGVFRGYPCTKDCSGHAAGYKWSDDRNITDPNLCPYSNNSFWEGCLAHTDEEE